MNSKINERGMFVLGVAICFAVAGLSVLVENMVPGDLLGASIIALFMVRSLTAFSILHG